MIYQASEAAFRAEQLDRFRTDRETFPARAARIAQMEEEKEVQRRRDRLSSEAYDDADERTPMHYEAPRVQANVRTMREQKEREERERQEASERAQAAAEAAEKASIEREQERRARRERDERARRNTGTGTGTSQFPFGDGRFVVPSHYDTLCVLPTASIEVIKGDSTQSQPQPDPNPYCTPNCNATPALILNNRNSQ